MHRSLESQIDWRRPVVVALCASLTLGALFGASAQSSPIPRPTDPPASPTPLQPWTGAGAADIARAAAEAASQAALSRPVPSEPVPMAARTQVDLFLDGCLAFEGELQPVVDWALNAGLMPQDANAPGSLVLLDGKAGSVFSPAGAEGRILLAVAEGRHCVLWIDRAPGPSIRLALLRGLGERKARGEKLDAEFDRKVERAGAWRQQTQWRWRRVGGSSDYGIGLVSTLTDSPASQVLRLAPLAPAVGFAPDGVPIGL
jgi:hypothetical protein